MARKMTRARFVRRLKEVRALARASEGVQDLEVKHEKKGRGRMATCAAAYDLTVDPEQQERRTSLGFSDPIEGICGRISRNCGFQFEQLPPAE